MGLFSGRIEIEERNVANEIREEVLLQNKNTEEEFLGTREQRLTIAENCCDQIVMCKKRMEVAKKEFNEVSKYLSDVDIIENLEGVTKENLHYEVKRIRTLNEDKKCYQASASKMAESKYDYINAHEEEMPKILKELKESEEEYQALNTDLHHIEGEKSALKYERKLSLKKMSICRKLLTILLVTAGIVLCVLTYGQCKGEYDFTIGYYLTVVITLVGISALLAVNKREVKNLRIAEIKLNKCIGLLNRYKLRYVNKKSSLDYLYSTYGITNSYELNNMWRVFLTIKKEREAYFTMSDNLYKATNEYMDMIKSLKLYDPSVWNYQMNAIIDEKEMNVIKNTLNTRRDALKKNLDYNNNIINNSKEKIKRIIEKDPGIADEIIAIVDKKEKEIA